jgi:arylsulfate sulfotransferase
MAPRSVRACSVLCLTVIAAGCASQAPPSNSNSNLLNTSLVLISVAVSPQSTAIATGQSTQFSAVTNDSTGITWSASVGTIDANGNYTAPSGTQSTTVMVTATSKKDPTKSASATVHVVAPGHVSATANVQVALYSISPDTGANVSVQFGLDTSYGLTTWIQQAPQGGGAVSLFVAGMKASTLYHMRGVVQFSDGAQFMDADQQFTTGSLPAGQLPTITATTTPGLTPQSGVELLDLVPGAPTSASPLVVTDLSGNVLWSYNPAPVNPTLAGLIANPIKLLPNGHFLVNFSGLAIDGANSVLQEVDLSGNLIWQMTAADLNTALAAATCSGCNITVVGTHHDFALLPNGHLIVIAAQQQQKVISGTPVTVTGDVLIDLDQNHKPVWLWNEFDHLDVNRQPLGFPDWTHTNAVVYSVDDGNLIISMRNQNWLLKVNYANGTGAGDVLWKLGYQGDFALVGGTDPADWFYAQHGHSFVTTNTTGKFSLVVFDDGDDRVFPAGVTCGTSPAPPCFYSTVPLFQIDEMAKTATLTFHAAAPKYSFFGGNAEVLKNTDVEYCDSAGGPGVAGDIYEVTQDSTAQTVWQMLITGQYAYRGQRIPSLYPGVQW